MGKQLKPVDILGDKRTPSEQNDHPNQENIAVLKEQAQKTSIGKPSPFQAGLRARLRDQVQFNFGKLPRFIVDGFEQKASEANMNKREYLYYLLREQGVEIPPYNEMDGRKL